MDVVNVALHRYFIWAERMRTDFNRWVQAEQKQPDPNLDGFTFLVTVGGAYMSLWYAALYVVVEGWQELGLHDTAIDALLASPNTDLLRRYRNGVCHFQRGWLDPRLEQFFASKDSAAWVRHLHAEFGRYFLAMYPQPGGAA